MGYLQVRDFPEELHEELKLLARKERRSVSQQTIIAIRDHVSQAVEKASVRQIAFNGRPFENRGDGRYLEKRKEVAYSGASGQVFRR